MDMNVISISPMTHKYYCSTVIADIGIRSDGKFPSAPPYVRLCIAIELSVRTIP